MPKTMTSHVAGRISPASAKWLAAHEKAFGPDAKLQDDGAPADVVLMRQRIAEYLKVLRQGNATKEGVAADRLFDRAAKLEARVIAVPCSSPRGIALKLRVALRDTVETGDPVLTARALGQVLPVLERMKPDDDLELVRREMAILRGELDDFRRRLGMPRPATRAKRSAGSAGRA